MQSPSVAAIESAPPLLELVSVRIEASSGPLFDGVSASARGPRVGLLGPWEALFRLLGGDARATMGSVQIGGVEATEAVARGRVGVARCDVPFPSSWSGYDYVLESARLAGLGRASERATRELFERLGLVPLAKRPLRVMAPAERRAILIAHSCVNDPPVLAVETPLDGLDGAAATNLSQLLGRAAEGRQLILSIRDAGSGSPGRGLLDTMDEVVSLGSSGETATQSADELNLADGLRYVVAVPRNAAQFAARLEAGGVEVVEVCFAGPSPLIVTPEPAVGDGPAKLTLRLRQGVGTDAIIDAALELALPLLHLAPVEPAFGHAKKDN